MNATTLQFFYYVFRWYNSSKSIAHFCPEKIQQGSRNALDSFASVHEDNDDEWSVFSLYEIHINAQRIFFASNFICVANAFYQTEMKWLA